MVSDGGIGTRFSRDRPQSRRIHGGQDAANKRPPTLGEKARGRGPTSKPSGAWDRARSSCPSLTAPPARRCVRAPRRLARRTPAPPPYAAQAAIPHATPSEPWVFEQDDRGTVAVCAGIRSAVGTGAGRSLARRDHAQAPLHVDLRRPRERARPADRAYRRPRLEAPGVDARNEIADAMDRTSAALETGDVDAACSEGPTDGRHEDGSRRDKATDGVSADRSRDRYLQSTPLLVGPGRNRRHRLQLPGRRQGPGERRKRTRRRRPVASPLWDVRDL